MFKENLLKYLENNPMHRGPIFALLGKAHPIFIEYPGNPQSRYGYGKPPHDKLNKIINRNREIYKENLTSFLEYKDNFLNISMKEDKTNPNFPAWDNGWLPGLDSVALYGFIAHNKPKQYFEIGSGNSTKFAKRAIIDQDLKTEITSFDPYPRAEIDSICDNIIRKPVEDVDAGIFNDLGKGDILFVDNSHFSFMNSDVTVVFLDILPELKKGVFVQFHDIFLQFDYPPEWRGRYFSEQYLLAAYILADENKLEVLFPSNFITHDDELKKVMNPLWANPKMKGIEAFGGSFWVRINKKIS